MEKESDARLHAYLDAELMPVPAEENTHDQEYFTPWGKIDAERTIFQRNLAERRLQLQRRREELANDPNYQRGIEQALSRYIERGY